MEIQIADCVFRSKCQWLSFLSSIELLLSYLQCPSGVQVIIVNCFTIGQKNWSSICQACVFEIAQKWNADRAANSPFLFVQQWKGEFVQRNYKNGIWLGRLKMVLPVPSVSKLNHPMTYGRLKKVKLGQIKDKEALKINGGRRSPE